jgi:hypothetical protein
VRRKPIPKPEPIVLPPYDGRTPILNFGEGHALTLKDCYEGIQVFGGTGSGKTSGSGAALALSFLRQGYGGLVLSAKPDDRALWELFCALTGRELTIFGPGEGNYFNFMQYENARAGLGAGLTSNLAELFIAIAETNQGKAGGMDIYWKNAMRQLVCRAIDLVTMAKMILSLPILLDVIMSAPQSLEEAESEGWKKSSVCAACLNAAEANRTEENGPDFDHTKRYWLREFPTLADRTRSAVVSMFTVIADGFLIGPIRKLFCTGLTTVPEETHAGKIIFVNLPVEVYNEVGVCAQMVWKHCWQRATSRREPDKDGGIPTFLWADESQYFCSSSDMPFQATARSKRACTVYLTQNLPTYYYRTGQDKTHSLLGNLQTKIFHANGCHTTNTWAADTIARGVTSRASTNVSTGGGMSFGTSEAFDYVVPPAEFQRLRKGGVENDYIVDAYVFQAGRVWPRTGESFLKTSFKQPKQKI